MHFEGKEWNPPRFCGRRVEKTVEAKIIVMTPRTQFGRHTSFHTTNSVIPGHESEIELILNFAPKMCNFFEPVCVIFFDKAIMHGGGLWDGSWMESFPPLSRAKRVKAQRYCLRGKSRTFYRKIGTLARNHLLVLFGQATLSRRKSSSLLSRGPKWRNRECKRCEIVLLFSLLSISKSNCCSVASLPKY